MSVLDFCPEAMWKYSNANIAQYAAKMVWVHTCLGLDVGNRHDFEAKT
jgi:hypothetical protein